MEIVAGFLKFKANWQLWFGSSLTPSLTPPVKFLGWQMHGRAGKQFIFRSYFECCAFLWKSFHMPVWKRKRKGLRVSNFALLLVVFKRHPGSEAVKAIGCRLAVFQPWLHRAYSKMGHIKLFMITSTIHGETVDFDVSISLLWSLPNTTERIDTFSSAFFHKKNPLQFCCNIFLKMYVK